MAFALNVVILCDSEGYRLNRYCNSLDRRISNPILSTSHLILLTLGDPRSTSMARANNHSLNLDISSYTEVVKIDLL